MIAWLLKPATRAWAIVPYVLVGIVLLTQAAGLNSTNQTAKDAHTAAANTRALADQTQALAHRLDQSIKKQTGNRASNVLVWCGAINGSRDYNRRFVKRVTQGRIKYTLPNLPCQKLASNTLKSTKP